MYSAPSTLQSIFVSVRIKFLAMRSRLQLLDADDMQASSVAYANIAGNINRASAFPGDTTLLVMLEKT